MSAGNFPSHLTNSRHFVPRAKMEGGWKVISKLLYKWGGLNREGGLKEWGLNRASTLSMILL